MVHYIRFRMGFNAAGAWVNTLLSERGESESTSSSYDSRDIRVRRCGVQLDDRHVSPVFLSQLERSHNPQQDCAHRFGPYRNCGEKDRH